MSENQEVTLLLSALTRGDDGAASKLIPVVYGELRRLAGSYMRRERVDHTLQATALVHEAYLKLVEQQSVNWQSRAHFFGVAAQLMRRILIDHARGHTRQKRGGERKNSFLNNTRTNCWRWMILSIFSRRLIPGRPMWLNCVSLAA